MHAGLIRLAADDACSGAMASAVLVPESLGAVSSLASTTCQPGLLCISAWPAASLALQAKA
jgi:hypothetical protein